jgi:hypothetical protein
VVRHNFSLAEAINDRGDYMAKPEARGTISRLDRPAVLKRLAAPVHYPSGLNFIREFREPLFPGERFRFRPTGKAHTAGDIDCVGCGIINGIRYPHPHREENTIRHLEFLVHGEAFQDTFEQCCEGGCILLPIRFIPKAEDRFKDSA